MEILRTKESLKDAIKCLRAEGKAIGFIPTMGALHRGHIELIKAAQAQGYTAIASIFVNPTQFGPNEDFSRYPRTEEADCALLLEAGCEAAYIPSVEDLYPEPLQTTVSVSPISRELCGAFRPGHFDGVAIVVTKLLLRILPDAAFFGEKDYQQLHIIRQCVQDLDIPVQITGVPTVREADGLALSSRNRYLNSTERDRAASLYRILNDTSKVIKAGQDIAKALGQGIVALQEAGFTKIDYIEIRDSTTLKQMHKLTKPARLLAAAWLGSTRLIDNIEV